VRELVDRFSIVGLVAGLPAGLSGKEGPQAAEVRDVAEALGRDLGLPLVFWDERLTSKMAERMLIESGMKRQRRQQHIDSIAASLMLQSYLNRQLLKDARIKVKINSGAK
jgi:putative pre-16S rRNA nuclease